MYTCFYCKEKFNTDPNKNRHFGKCSSLDNLIKSFKKEDIERLYYVEQKSVADLIDLLGFSCDAHVRRLFKAHGIKRRTCKEACNTVNIKEKRSKTLFDRTGTIHNFCKDNPSRKKWEARLLKEEGITNVFQREDVKIKTAKTLVDKYGLEFDTRTLKRGKNVFSSLHKQVCSLLIELEVYFGIEFKLGKKNSSSYYSYDILLTNTNKIIEVNGDYWHGNPKLYKSTDLILKGSSKESTMASKWDYDKKKIDFAKDQGYKVFLIWELDLKTNLEQVKKELKEYAECKD